jgi:sec-independent protein translocase protein TatC
LPIFLTAVFLFYLGAFFCYFVTLPYGINFLMGYQSAHLRPLISVGKYVSFCFVFIFGFGLTFELPLILALMSTLNIVKAAFLTRNRRYAICSLPFFLGVITPTPDFFNMTLMGGPLYILFEVGVILMKIIERKDCGWRATSSRTGTHSCPNQILTAKPQRAQKASRFLLASRTTP